MDRSVSAWLHSAELTLKSAGVETARLDVLVLLSDEIGRDKSWILAHPEYILQIEMLERLSTNITQRSLHVPLAYIRGHAEFYGRDFMVNKHVLVPRPESESMIELLHQAISADTPATIIDVGTGSGCLAITAKLENPTATVIATDIDKACLKVAEFNAEKLNADINFKLCDMLDDLTTSLLDSDYIFFIANLPYVPEKYPINRAAQQEPSLALFSGNDGLTHYRKLFAQAEQLEKPPQRIITESLLEQHDELVAIAAAHSFVLKDTLGLAQMYIHR